MKQVILASKSPRRKELLARLGFPFTCVEANTEEKIDSSLPLGQAIELVAKEKAQVISRQYPDHIVIGADTIVALDGVVYGKPKDEADAMRMLEELSGIEHDVITGVCLACGEQTMTFHSHERVKFYPLTKEEIEEYVASQEPLDKAGAYGIQGRGAMLVEWIHGDFFSIMGLPVALLARKFKEFTGNDEF